MTKVQYSRAALKYLKKMPKNRRIMLLDRIDAYADDPNSQAHDVKQMQGMDMLRLRVGDIRVIMTWVDGTPQVLQVLKIAARGDVYKR
jgi:mRNA interferase RelE/StbE